MARSSAQIRQPELGAAIDAYLGAGNSPPEAAALDAACHAPSPAVEDISELYIAFIRANPPRGIREWRPRWAKLRVAIAPHIRHALQTRKANRGGITAAKPATFEQVRKEVWKAEPAGSGALSATFTKSPQFEMLIGEVADDVFHLPYRRAFAARTSLPTAEAPRSSSKTRYSSWAY